MSDQGAEKIWNKRDSEKAPMVGGGTSVDWIGVFLGAFGAMLLAYMVYGGYTAFQNYRISSMIQGAVLDTAGIRRAIEKVIMDERENASSIEGRSVAVEGDGPSLGPPYYEFSVTEDNVMTITFTDAQALKDRIILKGKTIVFTPVIGSNAVHWDCRGGTLEAKYRPEECTQS